MSTLVAPAPLTGAAQPLPVAAWTASQARPPEWATLLARCGGSFFHAPPVLAASLPPGRPLYAVLKTGDEVLAVAAGVACACRMSARARHLRFAAFPAAAPGVEPVHAATLLSRWLARAGAAEVEIDSFSSPGDAPLPRGATAGRARTEWVLALGGGPLAARMSSTHRRHVLAGDRARWRLRPLAGPEAAAVMNAVQLEASRRAAGRGDAFSAGAFAAEGEPPPLHAPWGVRTFAAFDGSTPLAAARVGWGNRRAFYLVGGSTPEGYRRSAAAWLHASIAVLLAEAGFAEYTLGGTPAQAADPAHPSHGLHRFKAGFGATAVRCRGLRWEHAPAHLRAHRMMNLLSTLAHPRR